MKPLTTKWNTGEWPILNGVTFIDGRHYAIRPIDAPREPLPIHLDFVGPTQIENAETLPSAFLIPTCDASDIVSGLKVVAGECSSGVDGFIALLESTGLLRWVAFFDFSNPFERVRFEETDLVAENNLGEAWRLPLETPWKVRVNRTSQPKHGEDQRAKK